MDDATNAETVAVTPMASSSRDGSEWQTASHQRKQRTRSQIEQRPPSHLIDATASRAGHFLAAFQQQCTVTSPPPPAAARSSTPRRRNSNVQEKKTTVTSPQRESERPSPRASPGRTKAPVITRHATLKQNDPRCGDKRDFFFRHLDISVRSQLQIDDVAAFSVTEVDMANKISSVIIDLFPDRLQDANAKPLCPIVVTDGTACVGGNVMSFCDFFSHVYAVEIDATRFEMLQHNLHVLDKTNATCVHASYLDVLSDFTQDVVFLDAPWGGTTYQEYERVDLFLDDVPLYTIAERLKTTTQFVVLKVPSNFDHDKFARFVSGDVTLRDDFRKMHLVIVDYRRFNVK